MLRRLIFDEYEFDTPASEESLEIQLALKMVATIAQFRDLHEFVAATVGPDAIKRLGPGQPYHDLASCSSVRAYLKRFAQIDVPDPCDWRMYVLFADDLEWDGVIETPDMFIRYHWVSSA